MRRSLQKNSSLSCPKAEKCHYFYYYYYYYYYYQFYYLESLGGEVNYQHGNKSGLLLLYWGLCGDWSCNNTFQSINISPQKSLPINHFQWALATSKYQNIEPRFSAFNFIVNLRLKNTWEVRNSGVNIFGSPYWAFHRNCPGKNWFHSIMGYRRPLWAQVSSLDNII